jgi:hypothetical protein
VCIVKTLLSKGGCLSCRLDAFGGDAEVDASEIEEGTVTIAPGFEGPRPALG